MTWLRPKVTNSSKREERTTRRTGLDCEPDDENLSLKHSRANNLLHFQKPHTLVISQKSRATLHTKICLIYNTTFLDN